MKELIKFIKDLSLGNAIVYGLSLVVLSLFVSFAIDISYSIFTFDLFSNEKDCVNFYKENNYILNSCEKYRDKFEVLK